MKTTIEWTDKTWTIIRGCSKVSPGCTSCYAATMAARFSGPGRPYEGLAQFDASGRAQWTGEVRFIEDHLHDPLHWRKPSRIFVNSMSDTFHPGVDDMHVAAIWAVMAASHYLGLGHTFQVLTKRPQRAARLLNDQQWVDAVAVLLTEIVEPEWLKENPPRIVEMPWPLPNVWLGTSVEDQERADERIPHLLATSAAIRFLSCEPLLGHLDLGHHLRFIEPHGGSSIAWIICGGESGRAARPMDLAWARSLRDQCRDAGGGLLLQTKRISQRGEWRLQGGWLCQHPCRLTGARVPTSTNRG